MGKLADKMLLTLGLAISSSKANKQFTLQTMHGFFQLNCQCFFAAVSAGQSARVMEEIVV